MSVMWKAVCSCGWTTGYLDTPDKCRKALKRHTDDNPHRDFEDVPMF